MDVNEFWRIVEASRDAKGDQAAQMAALYGLLERLSAEEVAGFDTHFRACLKAANRTDVFAAATIIIGGLWVSDDAFQDFRGWLVSRGRAVYEAALLDPDSLAGVVGPGDDSEFEDFPYVAGRVWEEKTGRDRQETYPESETPSQSSGVQGPRFASEAEVRRLLPRLAAKFPES